MRKSRAKAEESVEALIHRVQYSIEQYQLAITNDAPTKTVLLELLHLGLSSEILHDRCDELEVELRLDIPVETE